MQENTHKPIGLLPFCLFYFRLDYFTIALSVNVLYMERNAWWKWDSPTETVRLNVWCEPPEAWHAPNSAAKLLTFFEISKFKQVLIVIFPEKLRERLFGVAVSNYVGKAFFALPRLRERPKWLLLSYPHSGHSCRCAFPASSITMAIGCDCVSFETMG